MRNPIRKWIPGLAVVLGFLMVLGQMGATPSGSALFSAARGLADGSHLGAPLFVDTILANVWRVGGSTGLSLVLWVGEWVVWAVVFLLVFTVTSLAVKKWSRLRWPAVLLVGGVVLLLCGLSLWNTIWNWSHSRRDLRLAAPMELAGLVKGDGVRIFANPSAHATLILSGVVPGTSPIDSAILATQPSRWRAALREKEWNVVVLAGPHGEFQPLLDHLLASPDWRLEALTNLGWLFKRERGPSNPLPKPEEIDLGDNRDSAIYLAQLSSRFDAMTSTVPARTAIQRALELAPKDATVQLHAAHFALERERWQDVVSHARRALRANPSLSQAHALAARAQLESGDYDSAEKSAQAALQMAPLDLSTRFLLARIQRANRDYRAEAETLERLISDSKKAGLPTAGYLAYLGQSYAQAGNAAASAKSYREAIASDQLDDEQRQAVVEALQIVESRSLGVPRSPESN